MKNLVTVNGGIEKPLSRHQKKRKAKRMLKIAAKKELILKKKAAKLNNTDSTQSSPNFSMVKKKIKSTPVTFNVQNVASSLKASPKINQNVSKQKETNGILKRPYSQEYNKKNVKKKGEYKCYL